MSTTNPLHLKGQSGTTVQYSKTKALNEREFELLLEGARELSRSDYYYGPDPELTIYALGRLGLRRGELAHLHQSWIDWRDQLIRIPAHHDCTKGKGGSVCGSCQQNARQRVEHADGELTLDEALEHMWTPKTEAAARNVYFGHDVRAELYLERYFSSEHYERYEASGTAIARRVGKAAELAPELSPDDVHPHSLRSTAASYMAGQGIKLLQIMGYFGWQQPQTARRYITRSALNTARHLDGSIGP